MNRVEIKSFLIQFEMVFFTCVDFHCILHVDILSTVMTNDVICH